MGNGSSCPLQDYSTSDLVEQMLSNGTGFQQYEAAVRASGMNGEVLAELDEEGFLKALDSANITLRLHRRKLLQQFKRAPIRKLNRRRSSRRRSSARLQHRRSSSSSAAIRKFQEQQAAEVEAKASAAAAAANPALENCMVSQSLETLMLLVKLENDNRVTKKAVDKDKSPPKDKAVIVLTDVQGSTNLWESNPVAMKKALALHDQIIRASRAKFSGYEIDTEGDAFFLALHNVVDAFGFALDLQKSLREAQWDEDILSFPEACHDPVANLRGLRVRMGIHLGEVTTRRNAVIGRLEYTGETMEVAKQVEGLADGGQIVTTLDTWKAASFEAKTKLGDPTILQSDRTISSQNRTKKVVQVCVPGTSLDSNSCHRKLGSNKKAERRYSAYHARAQCY